MIKVLFLSAWYPNRYDAMAGLFVRKHAEAVSRFCEVNVLYVHADKNIKHFDIINNSVHKITETIIYYPSGNFFFKHMNYLIAYYKGFKWLRKNEFYPDILHANVLTRTVFMALCYKILTRTPYVISEHWSRYLPARNGYRGLVRKLITRLVVKKSSAVLPVSISLKNAMIQNKLQHSNYHIIHNVVDDFFYTKYEKKSGSKKRFLHISCFDERAKNIKGILRATKYLSDLRGDFELIMIGTGIDYNEIYQYYTTLQFPLNRVQFLGEKTPAEVAQWLAQSDCFVLFSNYETAGVVIAESLACGRPVISTKVGIAEEFINNASGIIVENGNEKALTEAMNRVLDQLDSYDENIIKRNASSFTYQDVGEKILNIYQKILHNNH